MSTTTDPITIWAPSSINQTTKDRLKELIRLGGIDFLRANPDRTLHEGAWRDKAWMDGIAVDLDEDDVLDAIAESIISRAGVPEEAPR